MEEVSQQIYEELDNYQEHAAPDAEVLAAVHKKQLGKLGKLKVWTVNGKYLRSHLDVDFIMGANPARYTFVPMDELWIEDVFDLDEQAATLLHEYIEHAIMKDFGMDYDAAHTTTNNFEALMRDAISAGQIKVKTVDDVIPTVKNFLKQINASLG